MTVWRARFLRGPGDKAAGTGAISWCLRSSGPPLCPRAQALPNMVGGVAWWGPLWHAG